MPEASGCQAAPARAPRREPNVRPRNPLLRRPPRLGYAARFRPGQSAVSHPIDPMAWRFALNRPWSRALPGLLALVLIAAGAGAARAAAEVHKFSLVLSAIPTQIVGGDFNDQIDLVNRSLTASSLESLNKITYGWLFDAELRYFVRPNFAVAAGVGQLRSKSQREYSFTRTDDVTITAEGLSAPIHVGGDFYFAPYNQGDFQARAYV